MGYVPAHCGCCRLWVAGPGIYKRAGWASKGSKPVSNSPPWPLHLFLPLGSCLEFLPWLPSVMSYNLNELTPFQIGLRQCFITTVKSQLECSSYLIVSRVSVLAGSHSLESAFLSCRTQQQRPMVPTSLLIKWMQLFLWIYLKVSWHSSQG